MITIEMFTRNQWSDAMKDESFSLPSPTHPGSWMIRYNPHTPIRKVQGQTIRAMGDWAKVEIIETSDGLKVKGNEEFNVQGNNVDWRPV